MEEFSGKAVLTVNRTVRQNIQRHHTATHILHWAGSSWRPCQTGRVIGGTESPRFDFSHFEGVTDAQLQQIENLSNEKLLLNEEVESYEIPFSKNRMRSSLSLGKSMEKS